MSRALLRAAGAAALLLGCVACSTSTVQDDTSDPTGSSPVPTSSTAAPAPVTTATFASGTPLARLAELGTQCTRVLPKDSIRCATSEYGLAGAQDAASKAVGGLALALCQQLAAGLLEMRSIGSVWAAPALNCYDGLTLVELDIRTSGGAVYRPATSVRILPDGSRVLQAQGTINNSVSYQRQFTDGINIAIEAQVGSDTLMSAQSITDQLKVRLSQA